MVFYSLLLIFLQQYLHLPSMDIQQPLQTPKIQQEHRQRQLPNLINQFVLPGQIFSQQGEKLQYDSSVFMPTSSGLASLYAGFPHTSLKTSAVTLMRFPVQYMPSKNDFVIGIVKIRTAETFIVDIGAPLDATLGGLQFDGATKRNKPNLKVGSAVFCRVVEYSKHMGGKLSCINKGFTSSNKTNEMGELKQGYIFWIESYKHKIIQEKILQRLGKCAKFQVAFGKNGKIWVSSSKVQNTMLISNIFKLVGNKGEEQKINTIISMIK